MKKHKVLANILWTIMTIIFVGFGIGVGISLGVPWWFIVGSILLLAISGALGVYAMHKLMGDMQGWDK